MNKDKSVCRDTPPTASASCDVFTAADFEDCGPAMHPGGVDEAKIAAIANRILSERGVRVKAYALKESGITSEHGPGWVASEESVRTDAPRYTHTALLVAVQPIAKDTAESLLRELCDALEYTRGGSAPWASALERARKVLGAE